MPTVSVILTSRNHEKFLREAIDSVLTQSWQDFELIIWDDASTDGSWAVIQSYNDSRIKAFRNETQRYGVYGVNKAIGIAQGEYIAIHHSDDIWEPEKIEKQVKILDSKQEIGAVFTWVNAINDTGDILCSFDAFKQNNKPRQEWLRQFFIHGNSLCHPSILIRKQCYLDCGIYRSGLWQLPDFDMWIRLCLKYEIFILPEPLIRFRWHSDDSNSSNLKTMGLNRVVFEFFLTLYSYSHLTDINEIIKVFPLAAKYCTQSDSDPFFVLAMSIINTEPSGSIRPACARLFGQWLLFNLISDPVRAAKIKQLHNFDCMDFMEITKHGNIFSFVQNTPPLAADIQSSGNMDKLNAASKVDYTTITLLVWQRQLDFIPLVEYAAQLERNDLSALAAALYQTWLQRNATPPNPNLPFAAFNLGVLLAAEGDIAGARDAYLKAIEHTPSFLPPRINLGLVFERLGHLDEAIACWQWVEQHVSSNKTDERAILISALNNLGRLQGIQNNYLSALTALDKSLALEPDQPDLLAIYPLLMQNLHLIERSEGTIPGGLRNDAPPPATTSFCPVCNNQNVHWLPIPDYFIKSWEQYGYTYANSSEMTALDTYQCPICGASDRERMYAFFLKIISNKNWTTSKPELMLHFAPEQALSKHILQANYFIHYKTLDMAMPGVDFHVDLQHLPFNEDICDFFICSHVLEHVTDDRKAMKELFRITKPGGCGLLMAPICMDIKQTLEDPSLFNENERWHLFGQNDHVRLYSHDDYVSRIEESGFYLQQMTQHDFGAEIFRQLGLKSSSILYVVSKGYE